MTLDGVGGKCHTPVTLPPGGRLDIHLAGGWMGPRDGLDVCGKFCPHKDLIPGLPSL